LKKDYYEVLGIQKGSTLQQIKKAYRSLALKYHPDRVAEADKKESEEKFKEISEAYGVLSDSKKRQMYDQYGHSGIDQNFTSDDIFGGADFSSVFGDAGLGDIFSQFFGGSSGFGGSSSGGRSNYVRRGRDIQYEADITLEEAFSGVKKKIKIPRNEHCETCDGSGAKSGSKLKTCQACDGRGQVVASSGFFRMAQACSSCGGQGKIITDYCAKCNGKGYSKVTRNIDVTIPAGVDNTSRLRVRNEGEIAKGGAGDLYLYIHVLVHDIYHRDGNDIVIEFPLQFIIAALGGEVSIPTLSGKVSMKIPAATQSGKIFRLKGKGMPDVHGRSGGDQYVKVMIQVPKSLNAKQKALLEEFAAESGEKVGEKQESIKEKIKKVFK